MNHAEHQHHHQWLTLCRFVWGGPKEAPTFLCPFEPFELFVNTVREENRIIGITVRLGEFVA